jgi:hypothetical protein
MSSSYSMKNKNNDTQTLSLINQPKLSDPALWARIRTWHLPLAADGALTARIRASGTLRGEAPAALVLEYLRFAYLAWTSPDGATPSKAVDEVWHAHLLTTRSYDRFCAETRGERLHHDPGDGGHGDAERFEAAYRATLARYEAEFGPSPGRWWPRPAPAPVSGNPVGPMATTLLATAVVSGGVLAGIAYRSPVAALAAVIVGTFAAMFVIAAIAEARAPARPGGRGNRNANGGGCSSDSGGAILASDACGGDGGGGGDGGSSCGGGCGGG